MSPLYIAFYYQKPHNHGSVGRDRVEKDREISMKDLTFCVLWIERNRRLSPYYQNQVLGVIAKSQFSSKMSHYCAFQSHNKTRNTKINRMTCLAQQYAASFPRPLSSSILEIVFPLCLLLAGDQLEVPQNQQLGPFHSRVFTNIAQLALLSKTETQTNKVVDHPAWDLILHVFIFQFPFYFGGILNSEISDFTDRY